MRILRSPCGIHGSIEVGKQIGTWCIRYRVIGNNSWVYFRSSVWGGVNAISSGHGSPLGKGTIDPPISLTGHESG